MRRDSDKTVLEFFAGGGLARLGLEHHRAQPWRVTFANDVDPGKARAYRAAFGAAELLEADVAALTLQDLPAGRADLAWASFPCQDLSLAGARGGLEAGRSGVFWAFWRLMRGLAAERRAPRLIVLENVVGLLTSNGGADFAAIAQALAEAGYRVGALELDAAAFVPQSRPRVFLVAARDPAPTALRCAAPGGYGHTRAVLAAAAGLEGVAKRAWIWWRLPEPPLRNHRLADLLDDPPQGVCWNSADKTERLIALMAPRQRARLDALSQSGARHVGALFRRVRVEHGVRRQRVEARFDGLAGCLRTPAGGSSRQTLLFVDGAALRSRLISPREAARLMGAPDSYPLPQSQTAALQVLGDGVAPPVVSHLAATLLAPLLDGPAPAP